VKVDLEHSDIQAIAEKVVQLLRPLLSENAKPVNEIFDVEELAQYLHVSTKWVYKRTHLKEIPHHKVEGVLLFRRRDIDKWVDGYRIPVLNPSGNLKLIR
jgi:excisionase family DNA binding protein